MLYHQRMAERVRVTRVVILIGFLIAAVGFGLISSWTLPSSWTWTSYQLSQFAGFLATALFCAIFGWAFWGWLPRLSQSTGAPDEQRRSLQLFAAATLLLTIAYAAETYQLVKELVNAPFSGRAPDVVAAGYSAAAIGFGIAMVGFWITSEAMKSDGMNRSEGVGDPFVLRVTTCLIGVGLVAGGVGWVMAIWPERVAPDGATAKSVLIFGFANAAALVVMAPGFGLLLRRPAHSEPKQITRLPLLLLGCAFLCLAVSNMAFLYQDLRLFSGIRWESSIGLVLQGAGALATSAGFFASAWADSSSHQASGAKTGRRLRIRWQHASAEIQ
jgi:MFS family permease